MLFSLGMIIVGVVLMGAGMLFGGHPGVIISPKGIEAPNKTHKPYVLEKTKLDEFSDVELKIDSYADIRILPSEDKHFYLEYMLDGAYGEPSCEVRNQTLTLAHTDAPASFVGIRFFYIGDVTGNMDVKAYVTLYVPEDADMGMLELDNDCGNVSIEGLAFGDTKLDVSYGDLVLREMSFQDLQIEMESGKFKAEDVTAQDLILKNEYGDISLEKMTVQDAEIELESGKLKGDGLTSVNLTAKADYGNVELENFSAETADFMLESGNLRLDAAELTNLVCKSDYGDVKIKLPKDLAEYAISARSEYGHIDLPDETSGQYIDSDDEAVYKSQGKAKGTIKIEVESGDIVIE